MNDTIADTPTPSTVLPQDAVHGNAIRNVYIWVLVGVGLPGNLACLVTVLSMRVTTATFYVALLAAADSLALVVKLVFHQLTSHRKMTSAACILFFTPSFFSCYANWVLALICFERFFTVFFYLKRQVYFTKRRVYISVLLLIVALAVCFSPTPFMYSDVYRSRTKCVENESMRGFKAEFFNTFLGSLYFFAPFILIAVFSTLIIIGLHRHRQARQGMSTAVTGSVASDDRAAERAISIMLLCAGLTFLLLTLPACVHHLFVHKFFDPKVKDDRARAFLVYQVVTLLADTNHAVNFMIYFLSAARFRKRLAELLRRCFCFAGFDFSTSTYSSDDAIRLSQISQSKAADRMPNPTTSA